MAGIKAVIKVQSVYQQSPWTVSRGIYQISHQINPSFRLIKPDGSIQIFRKFQNIVAVFFPECF